MPQDILLLGVTGSRAYDIAHEGSDTDYTGVFAAPTRDVLGLGRLRETLLVTGGDGVLHEAGKAVRLLLQCNPSMLELLWLPAYEIAEPLGLQLVSIRRSFLSQYLVKRSYLEFADAQLRKAKSRIRSQAKMDRDGPVMSEARLRKHWRHTTRLCISGAHLWRTGEVLVRLDDADRLGVEAAEQGGIQAAEMVLRALAQVLAEEPCPLPETASPEPADAWLLAVREHYWNREDSA